MHITKVKLKDGREFEGILRMFRPVEGYMEVNGSRLYFTEIESAQTEDPRGYDGDELSRARRYMTDARQYNWHGELPLQSWERDRTKHNG